MMKKFFHLKILKFLLGGGLAAALNLLLIFVLIEKLNLNTADRRVSKSRLCSLSSVGL